MKIYLRSMRLSDSKELAEIRNQARGELFNSKRITKKDAVVFFQKFIMTGAKQIFMICQNSKVVGYIDINNSTGEIGIKVKKKFRGQGIGRMSLPWAMRMSGRISFIAEIKKTNVASLILFLRSGFIPHDIREGRVVMYWRKA